MNFMTSAANPESDPLNLDNIRRTLVRLEDTIIFSLIERAQFAHNPRMYTPSGFADVLHNQGDGFEGSWLDWLLRETETSHAKIRRYDSPDEHPFTPSHLLPTPILPPLDYPPLLYPNTINVNPTILAFYINSVVPTITKIVTEKLGKENDDGNYGSAGTRDIECLQAISRRIHCGMFVSESKFLSAPHDFVPHILTPNPSALEALITKPAVEAALLLRLEKKARWYGSELGPDGEVVRDESKSKVDVQEVVRLYREYIIPLTKDVEVEYLLHRLDGLSQEEVTKLATPPSASA
ncbi:chorismate mutase [Leucosporidium creatinivorum]|uniref:Chorismate mutase n=1 Tax=Leucosporidium creatinivorum TaxID=106004 RepID=A0A1Y2FL30_9BASI|nr:chorismate mutase [Leucosporidium creatinivorum]